VKKRLLFLTVWALLLLGALAAPAALAGASFIDYTASEVMVGAPSITSVTPRGDGVLKVTMANHFQDVDATHPWGNAEVDTWATLVVHTAADGQWIWANTKGPYRSEGVSGVHQGSFTGSVSFVTGETYYRFTGKGISGEYAGTVWTGTGYCPGRGDPVTQMTVRVLIP
jgi:hypothetical protein